MNGIVLNTSSSSPTRLRTNGTTQAEIPNDNQGGSLNSAALPFTVVLIKNITIPVLTLIFLFGMVGNTLTVLVLRTKRLRQSSTAIYLTALAIVDILYLVTSLLIHIINQAILFPNEVRNHSALACRLCPFLQYTLAYLSVWLIVAVTVDRAIWVTKPFQAKNICTKRKAAYTVTLLALTLVIWDSHFFWTMHYGTSHHPAAANGECRSGPFTERINPYIDLMLLFVIPFAFMIVSNILIGWQLKKMREFGRRRHQADVTAAAAAVTNANANAISVPVPVPEVSGIQPHTSIGSMAITYEYSTVRETKPMKRMNGHESKDSIRMRSNAGKSSALTTMLVAISVFFMVSVSPLMVYDVIFFAVDLGKWIDKDENRRSALIFGVERFAYTLWYTNFAVHFILYCLNGPPFRAKAMQLFRSRCLESRRNQTIHMNGKSSPQCGLNTLNVPQYSLIQPSAAEPYIPKPTKVITLHSPNPNAKTIFQSPPDIMLERTCDELEEGMSQNNGVIEDVSSHK